MGKKFSLIFIEIIFACLVLTGIKWGLPSKEIKKMYFSDDRDLKQLIEKVKKVDINKSWEISKKKKDKLPRSYFNLIRTFHPDEEIIIKSLSNMNPKKFDFNPHYFVYPAFYTYVVGFVMYILHIFKIIKLVPDVTFYFFHPEEMAKLYLTGRIITLFSALVLIFIVFKIGNKLKNKCGFFSAFLIAFSPLFFINSHYMTVDMMMTLFVVTSFFYILKYTEDNNIKYIYIASIFAGLSGGTKYPGIFIWGIIPFAVLLSEGWGGIRKKTIYISFIITIALFFAVNPYIILDYPEFKRDFISLMSDRSFSLDLIHNLKYSFINFIIAGKNGLGFILLFLSVISFIYSLFKIKEKNISLTLIAFFFMILPTFLTGGVKYARYYIPSILFLLLLSSNLLKDLSTIKILKFGTFLTAIFLLSPLLKTLAYTNLFYKKDVRVLAGKYINNNFKKDTKFIFLKSPWIFEVPPVDNSKFKIKVKNVEEIKRGEYLVIGELEYFLTIGSRKKERAKIEKEMDKYGIKLIKIFRNKPEIFGFNYYEDIVIHDILYPQPAIFLFKKK
ncbi:MAG: hypothetical protein DRP67_05070 [Candidatus Omnitrophota bacterium]|nr:MAG: hypothetical protein DRP67_05070 [Candidatus Omnitrophota bacterium]